MTASLEDLCDLVTEQVHPSACENHCVYLGLEHLAPARLTPIASGFAGDVSSNKFRFRRGDVLYSKLRPYLDKAVLAEKEGVCTTELLVLRPKTGVDPKFLVCVLHAPDFIEHAMSGVTGAHHPRTSWPHIARFQLPNFDGDEQRAIGALLWQIHELTSIVAKAEEATIAIKRAAMGELFTRGLRGEPQKDTEIGPVPESWEVQRLDEVAHVISTRMSYTELEAAPDGSGGEGIKVVGVKVSDMNTRGNEVELRCGATERYLTRDDAVHRCAPPGTIVFPKRGAAIATNKKRLTTEWSVFDPNVIGVIAGDPLDRRYLFHWFQAFDLRTITEPGPTPQLNKKNLEPLLLPVPPQREEQAQIAEVLEAIDRKIDLHRRKKQVLEELFKALLHKLMTGEIRVADLDLSALEQAGESPSTAAEAAV